MSEANETLGKPRKRFLSLKATNKKHIVAPFQGANF